MKINLFNTGQLQEKEYGVYIKKNIICRIEDENWDLIVKVNIIVNHSFPLYTQNITHSCFSTRLKEEAWHTLSLLKS